MMKEIVYQEKLVAIIVSRKFEKEGIEFFTPNNFSQQLGYMNHKAGKKIDAHIHNQLKREVNYTQEVLFIKKGKIRVDFYSQEMEYFRSEVLEAGDIILLASGGHGFEILEDCEMFEVKQGPFLPETDKIRFEAIKSDQIKFDS